MSSNNTAAQVRVIGDMVIVYADGANKGQIRRLARGCAGLLKMVSPKELAPLGDGDNNGGMDCHLQSGQSDVD